MKRFASHVGSAAVPQSVHGYHVIDRIGTGAGSVIYAVSHPQTHQLYALKHVTCNTDKDVRFVEQLEVEYEISRQFKHPTLRQSVELKINRTFLRKITDAILVMELFDGIPLELKLPRRISSIVKCFIEVARGLQALHSMGYVHCDLKPNNILLSPSRHVKIIDFGQTCRVGTAKRRIQGTPDFIAPEQVKCEPVTHRTDIFNFGATLYWALCGRKLPTLFNIKRGANSFLLDAHMDTPAEINPQLPETLSNFVMECARTNPAKRPRDMGEIEHRLEIIHHSLTRAAKRARTAKIA